MLKIKKAAALVAALALVAGSMFLSCANDSDDEEEDTTPSLAITGSISATTGGTISEDFTVTLKNDSFKNAASAGDDLSSVVTLSKTDFYTGTLSITAKEAFAASAKTATVTVSGTAAATAVTSTFTVTIAETALTGGVALTSNAVDYTIAPPLAITGSVSATAGGAVEATLTGTLTNDSFAIAADAGDYITTYVTLSPTTFLEEGYTIAVVSAIATGDTTAQIKIEGTAASSAATGTFTVTIAAVAFTGGAALTSNTVDYTIAAAGGSAATYEFVGKSFSDIGSVLTGDDKTTALTETDWNSATSSSKIYVATGTQTISGATVFSGGTGKFQVHVASSASLDLAFNGGLTDDISSGVVIDSLTKDRYISIPIAAAGTVAVSYVANKSNSAAADTAQLGVFNSTGAVLGSVASVKVSSGDTSTQTLTVDVTDATSTAYIAFSRNGLGGGGVKIYSITYTPSN